MPRVSRESAAYVEDHGPVVLLADLVEVRTDFGALITDFVAVFTLHAGGIEEQLLASPDVSGKREDFFGTDDRP